MVPYRSALFQGSDAYYSYQTCGASNEFEAFAASLTQATPTKVTALLDVVQAYLWSTREAVEQAAVDPSSSCSATEQCRALREGLGGIAEIDFRCETPLLAHEIHRN